jgi:hypothetical protein
VLDEYIKINTPQRVKSVLYDTKRLLLILLRAYVSVLPVRLVLRVLRATIGIVPSQTAMATFCTSTRRVCTQWATVVAPMVSLSVASRIYCCSGQVRRLFYINTPRRLRLSYVIRSGYFFILLRAPVFRRPVRSTARVRTPTIGVVRILASVPIFCTSTRRTCTRRRAMVPVLPVSPSVASSIYSNLSDRNYVSHGFRKCIKVNSVTR